MSIRSRMGRVAVLVGLAVVVAGAPSAAADEQSECFSQCHVMEVGCDELGGTLHGSCTYNPYGGEFKCTLPGCWCDGRECGGPPA